MSDIPEWWRRPRRISIVVDNPSWILPVAENLVNRLRQDGDKPELTRNHNEIKQGDISFFLGCIYIAPPEVLACNQRNLVVHESALPKGRGFSPLTWQIIEGYSDIPICLIELVEEADAGPVIYQDVLKFEGHELIEEMRKLQGEKTIELCLRYLSSPSPPTGKAQTGEATYYRRRRPRDSQLDPYKTIAEQFNLLRTVDNEKYPAFFDHCGHRYQLAIEKVQDQN